MDEIISSEIKRSILSILQYVFSRDKFQELDTEVTASIVSYTLNQLSAGTKGDEDSILVNILKHKPKYTASAVQYIEKIQHGNAISTGQDFGAEAKHLMHLIETI